MPWTLSAKFASVTMAIVFAFTSFFKANVAWTFHTIKI